MMYYMCQKSNCLPTWPQLEHAIKRNFGGLETKDLNPFEIFKALIPRHQILDLTGVPSEVGKIIFFFAFIGAAFFFL